MSEARIERPEVESELRRLKDFQRLSVDTVFKRLYADVTPTRRFLIADEVGLGKTLVARGIIARAIDHLWDSVERIDIIYLCSNADIARQNVRRLTPHGISGISLASRITLLPLETHDFERRKVNIIALTPGTSLDLKTSLGIRRERALLLRMLHEHWNLDWTGACRLFAGYASLQTFKSYCRSFEDEYDIDPTLRRSFLDAADASARSPSPGQRSIRDRLEELVRRFKSESKPEKELLALRTSVVGELRQMLASSCIRALQPDLIVLDEFQRFKELLDGEGPAGEMAKQLFEYEDTSTKTRVLLLSATPYKMYTVQDDEGNEDHYADFLRTARFLFADDQESAAKLGGLLQQYRRQVFRLGQGLNQELTDVRDAIETLLRSVMVRTERLAVTPDRSGMLVEKNVGPLTVLPEDVCDYARTQPLARLVDYGDTLEYWKAAPWLLNFMDDYKLRKEVDALIDEPEQPAEFIEAMKKVFPALLPADSIEQFRRLDPSHGRLRWLIDRTMEGDCWKLLWLPPTLPYYGHRGPFGDAAVQAPTKILLFSAWRIVPRVVAAALSHEAERRMYAALEGQDADLAGAPDRHGDQLRIARREERASGLSVLALLYPSAWLARLCDPFAISSELRARLGRLPHLEEVLSVAEQRLASAVEQLTVVRPERVAPDESWYWAAPILLDARHGEAEWASRDLAALWGHSESATSNVPQDDEEQGDAESTGGVEAGDEYSALQELVQRVRETASGRLPGGTPPRDLVRVLALIGVAGPANVALRAFSRVAGESAFADPEARDAAAQVGWSFRTLFNQPDSSAIVRSCTPPGDYWRQCLEYAAAGGLQAVLDEYAHLLVGEAGVFGKSPNEMVGAIAEYVVSVVALRRARVGAQHFLLRNGKVRRKPVSFRSRFAMRFGEERGDESGEKVRADEVRRAFNSPFWPFVLATTSVGQEGLDFHLYCHRVVHWNLPPNPVDLEQREGRVHRFKGHAVRKNVVLRHAERSVAGTQADPWQWLFDAAVHERKASDSDLVPYWVYPVEGGAAIERHVPAYPLSRDVERFKALRESLALYRMVFGQPRQEELLSYLARTVPQEKIPSLAEQLRISLAPQQAR